MSSNVPTDPAGVQTSAAAGAAIVCGACNFANGQGSQFCSGCGHSLFEPCPECHKPVILTQAFCGSCGENLKQSVDKRRSEYEAKLTEAVNATKVYEYQRARDILIRISSIEDFRFRDLAENAATALKKIDKISNQSTRNADAAVEAAEAAYQDGNIERVVELLRPLPTKILSDKAQSILRECETKLEQIQDLQTRLTESVQNRQWPIAGSCVGQLIDLCPDEPKLATYAKKIGDKLFSKAQKALANHRYSVAHELLTAVPDAARQEEHHALLLQIERLQWFSQQFTGEPHVTKLMGRLAQRWLSESNGDEAAQKTLDQIRVAIKQPPHSERDLYPVWRGAAKSWVGGSLGVLGHPQSIDRCSHPEFQKHPTSFFVAIGLALQGLGLGIVQDNFLPAKGLLSRLGRKKKTDCWGIDIGTTGVRAVWMTINEEKRAEIRECYYQEFDSASPRVASSGGLEERIQEALEGLLEQFDLDESDVWFSLPAREIVSRFVQLPPVDDKQAKALLQREAEQRLPIPLDEINDVRWIAELPEEESSVIGRCSVISAAKASFVEKYLAAIKEIEVEPNGLQSVPVALVNFLAYEFADEFAEGELAHVEDRKTDDNQSPKAVALVDAGAEATTYVVRSDYGFWYWSLETGGEDITRLIARTTKKTHRDTEMAKRDVAKMDSPDVAMRVVEQRLEETRSRSVKIVSDALTAEPKYDVVQTWCCGGGLNLHQWLRRVLSK